MTLKLDTLWEVGRRLYVVWGGMAETGVAANDAILCRRTVFQSPSWLIPQLDSRPQRVFWTVLLGILLAPILAAQEPTAIGPRLQLNRVATPRVVVSWTNNEVGSVLESTSLLPSADWQQSPTEPEFFEGTFFALPDAEARSAQYFRLRAVQAEATPPPLKIESFSRLVAWPAGSGDFVVEFNPDPADTEGWRLYPYPPVLEAGYYSVGFNLLGENGFFRLRGLPTDPGSLAPPPSQGVVTILADATAFLYTGTNQIQYGVANGTITPMRAAVVRGRVLRRSGAPLPGVKVSVAQHPEFGHTFSRMDGAYDLAVNGGGPLTLTYELNGFCAAQRQVPVPWQDYTTVPELVMVSLDPSVTTVVFGTDSPAQMARGSAQADADGVRRATLLFGAGTAARLVLADGQTQACSSLNVRATEYTVGTNGPSAMPAQLPPTSGYTYCVELSADEAISQRATSVQFDRPIYLHLENFLDFPVGMAVPTGYYDRQRGQWIASANGRVIKILGVNTDAAEVDTDGDDLPDNGLGLGSEELIQLAGLYSPGESLWRVPITHFTPWDCNWPYGPPDDARSPSDSGAGAAPGDDLLQDPEQCLGCEIEAENQVLGESIRIAGTPFTLNYRSDRTPGRTIARSLRLTLVGASLPTSLRRVELAVNVAGRSFQQTFAPLPNLETMFEWDGEDVYGRRLQGRQLASVNIGYVYPAVYREPGTFSASFGQAGTGTIRGDPNRVEITYAERSDAILGAFDARALGLGGWSLSVHHVYDPIANELQLGTGRRRSAKQLAKVLHSIYDPEASGCTRGCPLTSRAVAAGPDGAVYLIDDNPGTRIRRLNPDGTTSTIWDAAWPFSLYHHGLAVGPDGSIYTTGYYYDGDENHRSVRILRVGPSGSVSVAAGSGAYGRDGAGDGGPAIHAGFAQPLGVAVSPDGSLYIVDTGDNRIRRVGPDGIITTFAGNGATQFGGDGGPAVGASLADPLAVAFAPDGGVLISDRGHCRIRRVGTDGIIETIAGNGSNCPYGGSKSCGDGGPARLASLSPNGIAVAADGTIYVCDTASAGSRESQRVRVIWPDGTIHTVAGRGDPDPRLYGYFASTPARNASLSGPTDIALAPDGTAFIVDGSILVHMTPSLPGIAGGEVMIASEDGSELYEFRGDGRHLRTLDALTGATRFEFAYDTKGYLLAIIQTTGDTDNITTIERDADDHPVAIVGPLGQVTHLSVNEQGFLDSITAPAGETTLIASTADGLITAIVQAGGKTNLFAYDSGGRLVREEDPEGGSQGFVRTVENATNTVTRTTLMGRTNVFSVTALENRPWWRVVTRSDGTQQLAAYDLDAGTMRLLSAEGTTVETTLAPDPRFGMSTPILARQLLRLPNGLTLTNVVQRKSHLADPVNSLSLTGLTETIALNGSTRTNTYDVSTRRFRSRTAVGRSRTYQVDALGRVAHGQLADLDPVTFAYDDRGRIAEIGFGDGTTRPAFVYERNPEGYLATVTDPLLRRVAYIYDANGRILSKTLPGERTIQYGYDAASRLVRLSPPGRPAYTFSYSDRDELTAFAPPELTGTGPTTFTYDPDGALTGFQRPDGHRIAAMYETNGQLSQLTWLEGDTTRVVTRFEYDAAGRPAEVTSSHGVTNQWDYAGPLLTNETVTGIVEGTVSRTYDHNLEVVSESVNGAHAVSFGYDADGLLVAAGDLTIQRDPGHGLATATTLGIITTAVTHDAIGALSHYAARARETLLYEVSFTRDALGRILQRVETVEGVTQTYDYGYDSAGQLTEVTRDGAVIERYAYDPTGNRTQRTVDGISEPATFDLHDRLLEVGSSHYAHTAAGDMLSRTTDGRVVGFEYDPSGNLLAVTLPGGQQVRYVVDGLNRRVARQVEGIVTQAFLYLDGLRPAAEFDGQGNLVNRFVYAQGAAPVYLIRAGVFFRLITDHVGSVRLVVNAETGEIAQRLDYDHYGNVIRDTHPGFQPFGFAGGIYDPETGLMRFGARDYDPATGRWTTRDPIGFANGDINLYRYAYNDPVNRKDPFGTEPTDLELADYLREVVRNTTERIERIEEQIRRTRRAAEEEARELLRIRDHRNWAEARLAEVRRRLNQPRLPGGRINCGGLLGAGNLLLQAAEIVPTLLDMYENDRSLEEQAEFEDEQWRQENPGVIPQYEIGFLGPIVLVTEYL